MVMAETEYLGDPFTLFFYHVSTYSKSYKTNFVFFSGYYLLSQRGEKIFAISTPLDIACVPNNKMGTLQIHNTSWLSIE